MTQLVLFNTLKRCRKESTGTPFHQRSREAANAKYSGLSMHTVTSSTELNDEMIGWGSQFYMIYFNRKTHS